MGTFLSIKGTVLRETEKAVQFRIDEVRDTPIDQTETVWIPLSQVEKRMTDKNRSGEDTMMISEWIADKLGIL